MGKELVSNLNAKTYKLWAVRTRQKLKSDDTAEEMNLLQKLRGYDYVNRYSSLHLLDFEEVPPTATVTEGTSKEEKIKIKGQDLQFRSSWERLRKTIIEALPEDFLKNVLQNDLEPDCCPRKLWRRIEAHVNTKNANDIVTEFTMLTPDKEEY